MQWKLLFIIAAAWESLGHSEQGSLCMVKLTIALPKKRTEIGNSIPDKQKISEVR